MKKAILLLLLSTGRQVYAQNTFKAVVKDKATRHVLPGATLSLLEQQQGATADSLGQVQLGNLSAGRATIITSYLNYKNDTLTVVLPDTTVHTIWLEAAENTLEDVTIVASTRTNEPIENATTKVEVLGLEEMNEESTIKPGNIASILGDVSGVQVQQSSAVSGNANVRILGLDGRYTQLLRDGMPLYEGFSGGFGVLSILPLDLKQVELIKGSASTLYGGGAIGGLINFVSKRPGFQPDASFIINQTTLKETNLNAYYAQRWKKVGFTLFAGQTIQKEVDVDKDGLSDVPELSSTTIHPVLYFYPSEKSSISLGWSGSFDKRTGGDMLVIDKNPEAGHVYFETNKLQRNTFTLIAENRFSNRLTGTIKSSISLFNRHILTNTYAFAGSQQNYYTEASLVARPGRHTLVSGVNVTGDRFAPDAATPAPVGIIRNTVAGLFAQDTWQLLPHTKLEGGLRWDHHFTYGNFVLPRLALFHQFGKGWGTRLGFGMGYKNPNPLSPQIRDYDIYSILPLPAGIKTETSAGGSAEVNYKVAWEEGKSLFINHAFFLTQIQHPVVATEDAAGRLMLANANEPVLTKGFDTYMQAQLNKWEIYLGYTYTIAQRKYLPNHAFVPLTPRNRAAATVVYEIEHKWRFGVEASYTGQQYRDGDTKTPDYVFVALMVNRKLGAKWDVVLNCENLLDERQSRYEKLFTGSIAAPNYKPLWAPIDGRVINLSLRWQPFAKI
jgi:outer membrane receptor for ferrienterochelin and colicins